MPERGERGGGDRAVRRFRIEVAENGAILLIGKCDAANAAKLEEALSDLEESTVVDFAQLSYMSSAGVGLLFAAHKRLRQKQGTLTLINLNDHIEEVFGLAGFDTIFNIE